MFLMKEPARGQHESSSHLRTSSYREDLKGMLFQFPSVSFCHCPGQIWTICVPFFHYRYFAESIVYAVDAGIHMRSFCNRCLSLVGSKIHVQRFAIATRPRECHTRRVSMHNPPSPFYCLSNNFVVFFLLNFQNLWSFFAKHYTRLQTFVVFFKFNEYPTRSEPIHFHISSFRNYIMEQATNFIRNFFLYTKIFCITNAVPSIY